MGTTAETNETNALAVLGEAIESAGDTVNSASAAATAHAKIAAAKVQGAISSGAYNGAYGLSYGVVFTAVFIKEFLPRDSAVRRGLEDGAEAAFDAVASRHAEFDDAEAGPDEEDGAPETSVEASAKPKRATKRVVRSNGSE